MARNGTGTYNLVTNSWNPAVNGVSATVVDWQALIDDVAAAVTQSVSADGQTPITGNLNMGGNVLTNLAAGSATGQSLRWQQLFDQGTEIDVASATTADIGVQNSNFIRITGTTTITSFGTTYRGPRFVRFGGALTLTHNATTLILPTAADIVTVAGDRAIIAPIGSPASGWQVVAYQRASGAALDGVATGAITTSGLTMATARGLGRLTAGTGAIEELTSAQITASLVDAASTTAAGKVELATDAEAQTGTDTSRVLTPANLRAGFNASGSAPIFACRAWVNFNGTGTVAIRASGNVSSITDNGTGDYTVNFTNPLPDANYAVIGSAGEPTGATRGLTAPYGAAPTASAVRVFTDNGAGAVVDASYVHLAIFR